jgi:hypothetical protein
MIEMKNARRIDEMSLALDFFKSISGKILVKSVSATRIKLVIGLISKILKK